MDKNLVVAIACESLEGNVSIINLDEPKHFEELKLDEVNLEAGNLNFHMPWYRSIVVCTQDVLADLKAKLGIA